MLRRNGMFVLLLISLFLQAIAFGDENEDLKELHSVNLSRKKIIQAFEKNQKTPPSFIKDHFALNSSTSYLRLDRNEEICANTLSEAIKVATTHKDVYKIKGSKFKSSLAYPRYFEVLFSFPRLSEENKPYYLAIRLHRCEWIREASYDHIKLGNKFSMNISNIKEIVERNWYYSAHEHRGRLALKSIIKETSSEIVYSLYEAVGSYFDTIGMPPPLYNVWVNKIVFRTNKAKKVIKITRNKIYEFNALEFKKKNEKR